MSGSSAPEFSRPVALARVGPEPFRREIAADEAERQALARRFDLIALDRLSATVELIRRGNERILLHAAFDAAFVQRCVVTLDPVAGAVSEQFTLLYGPPEAEAEAGGNVDEPAFEPLVGGAIDIGEAVAQEFALALPPFPRCADADADEAAPSTGPAADGGPFAALARLVDRSGS
jgi:uncharacterized metal-binding protein YceD (DUF177 family)